MAGAVRSVRRIALRSQTPVVRGKRLALPAGVADRYAIALTHLVQRMAREAERELTDFLSRPNLQHYVEGFAADASPASQSRILLNRLKERFAQLFAENAKQFAVRMVDQSNLASGSDVHRSLKEISAVFTLKPTVITDTMREFMTVKIAENVSLIKSIPAEYMTQIEGQVYRSMTDGKGLSELIPWLREQTGVTERRAKLIATDQTHKAYSGLNRGRMEAAGIESFEWVHSGGGLHPRKRHQAMSGNIYRFDNLPVIEDDGTRGIPGQAINCRCTMVPVLKLGALK